MTELFVTVGNAKQPFDRLIRAVDDLAMNEHITNVLIQCGNASYQPKHARVVKFLTPADFNSEICNARVVICHGGAGTLLQVIRAGRTPIAVPRQSALGEHIDDHQIELVNALAREGRAIVVTDVRELGRAIDSARALPLHTTPPVPRLIEVVSSVLNKMNEELG